MADYVSGPDRLVLGDVTQDDLYIDWQEVVDVTFPERRIFATLSSVTLSSQSYNMNDGYPSSGDRLGGLVPVGGIGPFVFQKVTGDGDDDNGDITIDGYDVEWSNAPTSGKTYTFRVEATDTNGVTTESIITYETEFVGTPETNQTALGTPDSNPSMIIQYVSGATFTEPNSSTLWTAGDVREIYMSEYGLGGGFTGFYSNSTVSGHSLTLRDTTRTSDSQKVNNYSFGIPDGVDSNYTSANMTNGSASGWGTTPGVVVSVDDSDWVQDEVVGVDQQPTNGIQFTFPNGKIFRVYKGNNWPN